MRAVALRLCLHPCGCPPGSHPAPPQIPGTVKKYWEDGSRPNLQSFFERVQKRFAFRKVLGDIHTTLLSAVIPNAFRLVKRKPPSFFGASFLMGSLGGMGYFAYWYLKKKYI